MGSHRVQLRLAEMLNASWQRIDPFCGLDDYRDSFSNDLATGFEDAVAAVEGVCQKRQSLILEWRTDSPTYERLIKRVGSRSCKIILLTFAPPMVEALAATKRELSAKKRRQIRRFYERGCHRQVEGIILRSMKADPDATAASILSVLRDQIDGK